MRPESIKRISQLGTDLNEVILIASKSIVERKVYLETHYDALGISEEEKIGIGSKLIKRKQLLMETLWNTDSPFITRESSKENVETKLIRAKDFPHLRITKETNRSKGFYKIEDLSKHWTIIYDQVLDLPQFVTADGHAKIEDQINTLSHLYNALDLEIPNNYS